MGRRPTPKRRCPLDLETLEGRLTPAGAPELTIPLDPMGDRYGDQIVTVQAYQDASRAALSIFDTGATALTFSARDQAYFTAQGNPIPIKVPGGAQGQPHAARQMHARGWRVVVDAGLDREQLAATLYAPAGMGRRSASGGTRTRRYSSVSGAAVSPPRGLSGSNEPRGLCVFHCPFKSGYFASSAAQAAGTLANSAASSAIDQIEPRSYMVVFPGNRRGGSGSAPVAATPSPRRPGTSPASRAAIGDDTRAPAAGEGRSTGEAARR